MNLAAGRRSRGERRRAAGIDGLSTNRGERRGACRGSGVVLALLLSSVFASSLEKSNMLSSVVVKARASVAGEVFSRGCASTFNWILPCFNNWSTKESEDDCCGRGTFGSVANCIAGRREIGRSRVDPRSWISTRGLRGKPLGMRMLRFGFRRAKVCLDSDDDDSVSVSVLIADVRGLFGGVDVLGSVGEIDGKRGLFGGMSDGASAVDSLDGASAVESVVAFLVFLIEGTGTTFRYFLNRANARITMRCVSCLCFDSETSTPTMDVRNFLNILSEF